MKKIYMYTKLLLGLLLFFISFTSLYADCNISNGTWVENIEYVNKWNDWMLDFFWGSTGLRDCTSSDQSWSVCFDTDDRCKYSSFMWTYIKACIASDEIKSNECIITSCDAWYILSWDSCVEDTSGWSCVYSYSSSCSQWYSYNSSTNKCESIDALSPCEAGYSYNSSTWKCEDSWIWKGFCEENWFKATWDNLNCEKRVVSDPFYIEGDIYNNWILACGTWTSYNVISQKCEWFITNNESPKCNMYIDSFYDSDNWTTIRNTQFQWSKTGSNNKCVWKKIKNYSCTSWFILNSSTKQCEKKEQQNPSCSSGTLITSWTNEWKCELESNCWVDKIDWGWSDYSYGWWSVCDTSTGTKSRQWTRTCTNPTPFWGWLDCVWNTQETQSAPCSVNASCWTSVNTCNTWTFSDRTDSNWMAVWNCVWLNSWENKICQYNTDITAPSWTVSYSPSNWTNQNVTISVSCNDSGSGCEQSLYSKTVTSNESWNISIRDKVWNTKNISYNVTNIDITNPNWEVSYSQDSSTWNVKITVACSDSGSWCGQSEYTKIVTSNGTWNITINDKAWNTKNIPYNVTNIDNTVPIWVVSYTPSGWTSWNVKVTVTCNDSWTWCKQSTYTKTVTLNGVWNITISDNSWNTKNIWYNVTNIDKIKPTWSISHNTGWYKWSQIIAFSASDTGWSKLKRMYLQESVNGWSYQYISGTNYDNLNANNTVNKTYTRSAIDGNKYKYRLLIWDYTGQYSIIYGPSNTVDFDTSAPGISATHANDILWRKDNVSITLSTWDQGWSGIEYSKYIWNNNSCTINWIWFSNGATTTILAEWTNTLYLCAKDNAGNTQTWSGTCKFDETNPEVTHDYADNNQWVNFSSRINFTAIDPKPTIHSDIKETKYCKNTGCTPNISANFIDVSPDENTIYRFQSIDNAGNKSAIKEVSVKVEDNAPNISIDFTDTSGQNYIAATWTNKNINAKINCSDTNESINSGCNPDTYQFNLTDNKDTCLSNVSWFENYTSQWVNITTWNNTNKVLYICMRAKDNAGNWYSYSDAYEVKIDKITPNHEDISVTSWHPDTNAKLHANQRELSYFVDNKSWAPIVKIEWYFEDYENNDSFTLSETSSSDTLTFMWNMTKVDNDGNSLDGVRTYSFHITKIEDEAGNNISRSVNNPIKTYNYNVYANIDSNLKISLVKNDLNSHNIANGEINNMNIEVRDEFNNIIIPIENIWRKVNMVFSGQNTLKLNQYNTINSDSSIFVNIPNSETLFKNDIFNSWDNQYNNLLSNNWTYTFEYKIYTPTFNGIKTNGQQYVNGWAHISEIEVKTQQDLGINNVSETEFVWNKIEPNIDFDFRPIIYTKFDWDFSKNYSLNQNLENKISFINTDSSKTLLNKKVFLWFGKATQDTNSSQDNLNLIIDGNSISEWHQTNITNLKNFNNFTQKSFSSEIKQTKDSLTDDEKRHYISSHIWYTLDWKDIFYNSDIIWKTNYSEGTLLDSSINLWVKVLWNVQSKNQTDISDNQSETDIYQLWNNTKADLKEKIKKNVADISMNVTAENVSQITNIWWDSWDNSIDAPRLLNQKILLTKWEVKLSSTQKYTGKKTLVIQWWNLYITENLLASNKVNDILWIIVLADENGNGWNVYINPNVTAVEAVIFADKSLLNYDGSNVVTDGRQLKNQFYFYWTLFSENTLWWYVSQVCPYFETNCTSEIAEKYDLNFLRSYYAYDSNDDGNLDSANWNSYFNSWDSYFAYPVIFEYNANIQNNPPELFDINE